MAILGIEDIGIGLVGTVLLVVFIVVLILALITILIVLWIRAKQYKYRIPLYANVGGRVTRVATFKAREVGMGVGGEKLWFVKKAKKWIPPPVYQTAQNEFPHFMRDDREWINFQIEDLNEKQKLAGVRFIQEDMRFAKVGIEKLLEQRLMKKGFWEKYQHLIMNIIYYLIMVICVVIIFYMFGQQVEKMSELIGKIDSAIEKIVKYERGNSDSLIPVEPVQALILIGFWRLKNVGRRKFLSRST